ncbi:MAG: tetratricopeptide repeat protein [Gemmatimonadales bacterium]|nr:tetratricopeptide repeat protein [Gemmatimonadales bacterium]
MKPGAILLFLMLVILVFLGGCGSSGRSVFKGPSSWSYNAAGDSLGLEAFLDLPDTEQARRRELATAWRLRARKSRHLDIIIHALNNAGGLAPDDPETWLAQARLGRWVGGYVHTVAWLDNAAAAVRYLGEGLETLPENRESPHWALARETALLRGWLHYDRAEWHEGLSWVNPLARRGSGDAQVMLLRGLLAGGAANHSLAMKMAEDIERNDVFDSDAPWIKATLDRARGFHRESLNHLIGLRPDGDRAAECWREMGEVAEQEEKFSNARQYYRESFHSLPFPDTAPIERILFPRLGRDPHRREIEFWLAFDRYYVTGSLSAYTGYAWARFLVGEGKSEREFWAGQAVNGAGILLRKGMDQAWSLRIRGLVFLETGQFEQSLEDLRKCSSQLKEKGLEDPLVEAGLGRILLHKERYHAARPYLRRAVALDPGNAQAWADLGLSLVLSEDQEGAKNALDRSIQLDQTSATAWYNRGLLYLRAGEFAKAETDLAEAIRLAPGNQEVMKLLQRAHTLQRKGIKQ